MKVLIAGGAGYVGSVVTRLFLSRGAKVIVLDNLLFGGESLLDLFANSNFKFIYGDVRKKADLKLALKDVDVVINLAALVGEPLCSKFPKQTLQINYHGACSLADIAKSLGVKKYIFVSTCSNYGININNAEATEQTELNPLSLYAETKIKAEKYILKLTSNTFSTTIIRFATIFGLSPRMRFDLIVSGFVKEAFLTGKISVYNPKVFRPLIHVNDAAQALFLLSKTPKKIAGEVFNIGLANFQKEQIIQKVAAQLPKTNVKIVDDSQDNRDYKVSFKKIKDYLGFRAKISLDDGIKEIIQALNWGIFPNPDDPHYTFKIAAPK